MDIAAPAPASTPAKAERVLVLQGGGALGSYQAGAFQALCHQGFEPEWIAGISIGAINAAIIAGNPPQQRIPRLKEFWELVSSPVPWSPLLKGDHGRTAFNGASAALVATFGVPGFFTPRFPPAPLWPPGSPQSQSYYDTAPLRATLERLVDFDRINELQTRLSIGAVSVTTGNFRYFDNVEFSKLGKKIGPEHIMASGALPPGFPSIEIEGEHYWDGGIASNTPLDYVLDEETARDLLIFQVDLFSARGPLPETMLEAAEREKDIRYSSRTRMNTDKNKQIHNTRKALCELIAKLPERVQERSVGGSAAGGGPGKHRHRGAPDLSQQELRIVLQGLRLFACRHGRTLERGRPRRPSVDAPQGMAAAAAIRRNHGDLRSHGRRQRSPRQQTGVKTEWVR